MAQLFLASSADYVLDDIVKYLSKKPDRYNLAFINTAAEVEGGDHWWVTEEKKKLVSTGFQIDEFTITDLSQQEIISKIFHLSIRKIPRLFFFQTLNTSTFREAPTPSTKSEVELDCAFTP